MKINPDFVILNTHLDEGDKHGRYTQKTILRKTRSAL